MAWDKVQTLKERVASQRARMEEVRRALAAHADAELLIPKEIFERLEGADDGISTTETTPFAIRA